VIVVQAGPLGEPAERLLAALAQRGHPVFERPESAPPDERDVVLAVSDGAFVLDMAALVRALVRKSLRVLVLSRLGAHPDARASSLQRLWRLEEHVRATGLPSLTLRFGPLVGSETPLWRKLRSRPALPRLARKLVNPVAESDAIETLDRALAGRAAWEGWYEVAGPDAFTLAELRDLAAATTGPTGGGAWEPPLEEIAEHRLAESEPWASHFGIAPAPVPGVAARGVS